MLCCLLLLALAASAVEAGRVKVVVHGESFRINSRQFHCEFGLAGWRPQREATRSQATYVILPLLLDMGYDGVDVQLDTQESEWRPDLVRWWSAWLTSQEKWRTTYEDGKGGLEERYEGVLFIRADMVAKPLMRCALSRANRSLILFSFREWHFPDGGGNFYDQVGDPAVHRIADAITWIPRRLFSRISTVSCLVGNHEAVLCARNTMGIAPEETGYLLPGEQHDSDPLKDWNPLYSLATRVEAAEDNSSVALDWTSYCAKELY